MKLRLAKWLVGVLLLPLAVALTMTFGRVVFILAQSPARLPMLPAAACVAGIAIWAIIWLFLPPLTRTYVLGHELTTRCGPSSSAAGLRACAWAKTAAACRSAKPTCG